MKQQLNLAILILLTGSQLFGQAFNPSKEKLYQSLIGEVNVLSIFVDTADDYWEDDEKEFYLEELNKSQSWIIDQAAYYNVDLTFDNDNFFENGETVLVESFRREHSSKYKIKSVMKELGFDGIKEYLAYSNFDLAEEKLKLLFFVKSRDRSHAYNKFSNKDVDLGIIYCRSTYGMITDNFVISHEILHQFGAWDLYYGKSQTTETAEKAKEFYPNSIMISTKSYKEELEVDDLTAWRVGWHYEYKEAYVQFDPQRRSKGSVDSMKNREKPTKSIQFDLKRKNKN